MTIFLGSLAQKVIVWTQLVFPSFVFCLSPFLSLLSLSPSPSPLSPLLPLLSPLLPLSSL